MSAQRTLLPFKMDALQRSIASLPAMILPQNFSIRATHVSDFFAPFRLMT